MIGKYKRLGVIHDQGPFVPYGGYTTACMYTGVDIPGRALDPVALEEPTTCVACLGAPPETKRFPRS